MSEIKLTVKKYKSEGDLAHEYNPLHNKLTKGGVIEDFETDELQFDLNKPVDIECQPSYDGTVNLIINDDLNPPRIVNTTYSVIEDNKYRRILRNQTEQTNLYKEGLMDAQTRLFRNINKIPKIELLNIAYHGQLKGGNYTIYLKLADNDYNKTDVIAESGIISVFKGTLEKIYSISGTLEDERTDKAINLQINNIDTSFSKVFVYVRREYSDLNGILKTETFQIKEPYKIVGSSLLLTLDGFEETLSINEEELNIKYNICTGVKTQAQVQNMLFFGNVQQTVVANDDLQNISYFIEAECVKGKDIGYVRPDSYTRKSTADNVGKIEYYNPVSIYYSLGYWPEELYRLGIVYIFLDDSISPVYNLRGCKFTIEYYEDAFNPDKNHLTNFKYGTSEDSNNSFTTLYKDRNTGEVNVISKGDFFLAGSSFLANTKGVFKFPRINIQNHIAKTTEPIGLKFTLNSDLITELSKYKVKGFFFVRQKRIPNVIAQGYSIGVDKVSYIPMLFDQKLKTDKYQDGMYFTESFINSKRVLSTSYKDRIIKTGSKQSSGLLCVDAMVNHQIQSMLDNSEFLLTKEFDFELAHTSSFERTYQIGIPEGTSEKESNWNKTILNTQSKLIYIPTDVPLKYVDDYGFSTRAGSSEDVKDFRFFSSKNYEKDNNNIVRGVYCPFVGTNQDLKDNAIYTIRVNNYSQAYETQYFKIRGNDLSPFMAISPRYEITDKDLKPKTVLESEDKEIEIHWVEKCITTYQFEEDKWVEKSKTIEYHEEDISDDYSTKEEIVDNIKTITSYNITNKLFAYIVPTVFRGDCFTATVTTRINTNFIDSEVPTNDMIVNPNTWKDGYKGYSQTSSEEWKDVNRADINTVPMGQWFTYKCLSNYNLGLRSENRQNVEEMALMGNARSFYPLQGMTVAPVSKIPESQLLNAGYSTSLPFKKYFTQPNVPYVKDIFDTRIMFSNVQIEDDFRNAYRIFQGLSYKDIERQYGAIVKLLSLGANLFCVFEHGCAIIPINEKALIATSTGQAIHMYGSGVLQNQVTPISPDYGSIWQESIIRTPNGIYGVDTYAKKIWRYNTNGFQIISDMAVQRFLHDNIILQESDKYPIISLKNVKTHFNNYKGDVMFTFYNGDKVWNLCYNERLEKWITKYSWTPLASENINNIFLSLDRKRASIYGIIYDNINTESGPHIEDRVGYDRTCGNLWEYNDITRTIVMKGYEFFDKFNVRITSITSSVLDENDVEHTVRFVEVPENEYDIKCKISNAKDLSFSQYWIGDIDQERLGKKIGIIQDGKNLKLVVRNFEEVSKLLYLKINFEVTPFIDTTIENTDNPYVNEENISEQDGENKVKALSNTIEESIVLIRDITELPKESQEAYEKLLRNGFYVHGRAGIFNEINYFDENPDNEILPTKWYNKQEPFEFEFIVNTPAGVHKIFDNLVMISNNVEPETLEFEIIGDVYDFNKAGLYKSEHANSDEFWDIDGSFDSVGYAKKKLDLEKATAKDGKYSQIFDKQQVEIEKDHVLNQYILKVKQPIKNIKTYGRRLGNIEYKEDRWFTTITPIYYKDRIVGTDSSTGLKSTRIRDKWIKIRIKYTGEKLVVINAIQSLLRLSYA